MNGNEAQYSPLLQATPSDDEDEFDGDYHRKTENGGETVELRDLTSVSQPSTLRLRDVVRKKRRRRICLVTLVLTCILVTAAGVGTALSFLSHNFSQDIVHDVHFSSHGEWSISFEKSAAEKAVTLLDVDGDRLEDVLVGLTDLELLVKSFNSHGLTAKEVCIQRGLTYPCTSWVIAFRGYDGKELWRTWLRSQLLFSNCDDIDINRDKKPDCILSGRTSTLQAVDLATGKTHWIVSAEDKTWSSHFVPGWLVCRALSVPDVDGDGVIDFIVTHGGDQSKQPEDHDRAPGRVIFVSGATGKPIGRYLEMPNSRETYMSPVKHVTANGTVYILLGSGGETVSGDLMIISYTDLLQYVTGSKPPMLRTIFRGSEKGVILPPVLVDITQDGTSDILTSAFEGVVVLYDGETLQEKWRQQFPGMESYSVPAPGHYNDDGVLDFMVMWGHGYWDVYDYAITYIISGQDGSILWQTRGQMIAMYSSLTLKTTGPNDLFLFRTAGAKLASSVTHGKYEPADRSRNRQKRHIGGHADHDDDDMGMEDDSLESFKNMCGKKQMDYLERHLSCSDNLADKKEQVLLMDPAHSDSPAIIFKTSPQAYHYTEPVNENGRTCHNQSTDNRNLVDICVVTKPLGITGAVGDVDGDGEADFIQLEGTLIDIMTDTYNYNRTDGRLVLSRISLSSALKGKAKLLPMTEQPWRQYRGYVGDSEYRTQK